MSRLELDDQILNHPKFIRAAKLGGPEAIFMWLGIRAYVGQNMSDGFVPADMVDEVRGPVGKKRVAALKALVEVGLMHHIACGRISEPSCERCATRVAALVPVNGAGILMHDYLQWSRSKSQVLADRERSRDRQAKSRGKSRRDIHSDDAVTSVDVAPASASASASTTTSTPTTTRSEPVVGGDSGDPGIETMCPTDLIARLEASGMVMAVAEKLKVPIESVRHELRQFEAYWTIGKGAGQRRTGWPGKARQWVVDQHAKPGGLKARGVGLGLRGDSDWPTDEALRLREAIRAGKHGESLRAKERIGQLDHDLARRLIREQAAERAERRQEPLSGPRSSSRPPPNENAPTGSLAQLAAHVGRPMP